MHGPIALPAAFKTPSLDGFDHSATVNLKNTPAAGPFGGEAGTQDMSGRSWK